MLGQIVVQKTVIGKQHFAYRAIGADDVLKKVDRLVVEIGPQAIVELRKLFAVDTAIAVELIKAEPLTEKLSGKATGLGIGQHAAGLPGKLRGVGQLPRCCGAAQLSVRQ